MKVCAYVMEGFAKANRVGSSQVVQKKRTPDYHDKRMWMGFEIVLDACRRAGYVIEYAGRATVHEYDIVLMSITSDCDWWPWLAERATWKGSPLVIAGGAGVLNVRPFLQWVDCFVLGRGEHLLPAILAAHATGNRHESPSVVWSDSFSMDNRYEIMQASEPYPHEVIMTNGKPFREGPIGCPNKCFFCGYTWHRRYNGSGQYKDGNRNVERTIFDLLKVSPDRWQEDGQVRIVGLDGMSERLRRKVNKPITSAMFREFLHGLATINPPHQVKVYCVIGYPTETEADWHEFIDDLQSVDNTKPKGVQWSIALHCTPFRAMPATPAASWEMPMRNLRGKVSQTLKRHGMKGNIFYQGNRFWAVEDMATDSFPTVAHSALCLRGVESDGEIMMKIACAKKYWSASSADKTATLEKHVDLARVFGGYTRDTLPTRYLPCRKWGS